MRVGRQLVCYGAAIVVVLSAAMAQADVFNMAGSLTSLSFVPVGDANNPADPLTAHGSVDHAYQMGTYDVTVGQYCEFLNAVAKTDTYGLYNAGLAAGIINIVGPQMSRINITRNGDSGNYSYTVGGTYLLAANCPIFDVSWGSAARFVNWLQNGQPQFPTGTPGQVANSTETGAYTLNGITDNNLLQVTRNPGATYFIPNVDEWYKAAYYKGGTDAGYWYYPTQSDVMPGNVLSSTTPNSANYFTCGTCSTDIVNELTQVGAFKASPGPYGTYDQGGNVCQWLETTDADSSVYMTRGGNWQYNGTSLSARAAFYLVPTAANVGTGFRVGASMSAAEPGSVALLLVGAIGLLAYVWRRRAVA